MKPAAAMPKPAMIIGERVWTLSDQKAKMIVMIIAKTYIGMVRSWALADE